LKKEAYKMAEQTYGYARVSTQDQELARQLDALKQYGVRKIYCEKMTGTKHIGQNWKI
jgi:DNA invertase Pin-like site-specific DNA recombinase